MSLIQFALAKLPREAAYFSRMIVASGNIAPQLIAGAWLALALGSRWRRETNWVGWAGRALGIGWIGVFLLGWCRMFV
jgi:hypothetical protein